MHNHWLSLFAIFMGLANCCDGLLATEPRFRVVVSTDIGGTDPDDFQSLVHLLVYADQLEIEGLISSPYGPGRREHILKVLDCYDQDFENLKTYSHLYPSPAHLRSISKQGETEVAPYAGYRQATEGSSWIIECARRPDPRPLYVLAWGGLEDLAQALHDAPEILGKLRVYWIGGPNKKWSPDAYQYLATHHPQLWFIEANSTYRGWFVGGDQADHLRNTDFVTHHVRGHGALGDFFASHLNGSMKMGDTPSVTWLLGGNPAEPDKPGWGGQFRRATSTSIVQLNSMPNEQTQVEQFSIVELSLPFSNTASDSFAELIVDNQSLKGHRASDGTVRFRFCPKDCKTNRFTIKSDDPALNGMQGAVTSIARTLQPLNSVAIGSSNWWTDLLGEQDAEGVHAGARSVSRWRREFLASFAERMQRCNTPNPSPPAQPQR